MINLFLCSQKQQIQLQSEEELPNVFRLTCPNSSVQITSLGTAGSEEHDKSVHGFHCSYEQATSLQLMYGFDDTARRILTRNSVCGIFRRRTRANKALYLVFPKKDKTCFGIRKTLQNNVFLPVVLSFVMLFCTNKNRCRSSPLLRGGHAAAFILLFYLAFKTLSEESNTQKCGDLRWQILPLCTAADVCSHAVPAIPCDSSRLQSCLVPLHPSNVAQNPSKYTKISTFQDHNIFLCFIQKLEKACQARKRCQDGKPSIL